MERCTTVVERWVEQVKRTRKDVFSVPRRICSWLPWPIDELCKTVVDVVEKIVEWFEDVVHEIAKVVCVPIDLARELAAAVIEMVTSIPILGPIVRWVVHAVEFIGNQLGGLPEGVVGLIGFRPIKHLYLYVVILRNERGPLTTEPAIQDVLHETERIFRSRAQVRVHTAVHVTDAPAPSTALHIDAEVGILGEDLTVAGSYFQSVIVSVLGAGVLDRRPAPIFAFVVEGVGNSDTGCSAGPLADWVVVEPRQVEHPADQPMFNTLAHEVGHACGLAHTDDVTNLLNPIGNTGRGDNLSPFQRMILRNSSHVAF